MNPIKTNLKTEILPITLMIITGILSFYFYNNFPSRVPIHWNVAGQPDNWGSPAFAAFMIPCVVLGMYIMFLLVPMIDPKKERYKQFQKTYHIFKNSIMFFMVAIYLIASFNALGYNLPIDLYIPFLIGLMFIIMGNYLSKIKPNWFMGIRTPWTLSSEYVWNKTHRLGGKIFIFAGIVLMCTKLFPPSWRIFILLGMVSLMVFGTFGYSFFIYIKQGKK